MKLKMVSEAISARYMDHEASDRVNLVIFNKSGIVSSSVTVMRTIRA